jgi:23S rRNA (uracil1939-C5)-methyltransferase
VISVTSENSIIVGNIYQVVVEKLVFGGYGLGFIEGSVPVFIDGVYPGEIVKVSITEKNRGAFFAQVEEWVYRTPERNRSTCSVFNQCGSCHWLDYDYLLQLTAKKEIVREQFRRIGKIDITNELLDVLPSQPYGFRNKMEYEFQYTNDSVALGLKRKNTRTIIRTKGCKIVPDQFERIRNIVESLSNQLVKVAPIYNRMKKTGVLKNLVIRSNRDNTQFMVIFVTHTEYFKAASSFVKGLLESCPFVTSIIHLKNSSDSTVLRGSQSTLYGEGVLTETLTWFQYQIPPVSFFQTNRSLLEPVLGLMKELLNPKQGETLLDLYAGVGFFSVYLAPLFDFVWTVEGNAASEKALSKNIRLNSLKNVRAMLGNIDEISLPSSINKKVTKVIVDPPRSGLTRKTIDALSILNPELIVYLSCDPATLARDIALFLTKGFVIKEVRPIDMFPHTAHIECIASLSRSNTV